jgi:hypothetical protein
MTHYGRTWAYKPDGSACVFEMASGDELPEGWSHDISVIVDPEKRTGEAVSRAARESLIKPVRISKAELKGLFEEQDEEPIEAPLQYDQDLQQVSPPKPRGRGPLR